MTPPIDVTREHLLRAHAQIRCERPDMPPLDVLQSHWVLYSCIRNRALGIARGDTLPPVPMAAAPPAIAPKPPAPHRRRDDPPRPPQYSTRAAQAGEYAHKDEDQ